MYTLKRLASCLEKKIDLHTCTAILLILVGVIVRLASSLLGIPILNSDDTIIRLMALHINNTGARPIFFYGQNYMGAFEAYAGALAFRLFGTSVMSMRYVTITLYAAFLTGLYLLTSRLYTRAFALLTIAIFVFVSPVTLQFQILSVGGYAEIVPLCVLLILVSYFLVLTRVAALLAPTTAPLFPLGWAGRSGSVVRPTGCSFM